MNRTRRTFLLGTATVAGIGALAYAARFPFRAASPELQPLRIPALLDARKEGKSISLKVQAGRTAFFPGRESATLGYNGGYLGPTIRLYRGDETQIAVSNALNEDTNEPDRRARAAGRHGDLGSLRRKRDCRRHAQPGPVDPEAGAPAMTRLRPSCFAR